MMRVALGGMDSIIQRVCAAKEALSIESKPCYGAAIRAQIPFSKGMKV